MRSQNIKVNNVGSSFGLVGKGSCLGLLVLGMMLACPACDTASALTSEELESGSLTSSVSIAFAPSAGSTTLSPTGAAGTSGLISVLANVGVTNSGGYSVYLGSNSTNLVGKNNAEVVIPGVSGEVSFDNLQDNTWGYYAGEGSSIPEDATYKAVSQGQGDIILANNNSRVKNENKTFVLGFAAKINNSIPADTYENQVTLSVVSNPYQLTLMDIDNMQDMTSSICENTPGLATKQLKDARDGKYYWVAKLADNNCWMTQNLDLDLSTSKTLTNVDTDLRGAVTSYTPAYNTATVADENTILADNVGQRSWDLGDVRIINPTISSDCGMGKANATDCPEQFVAYATPTKANGDELAHYILGNFYQWNAATAGTGGAITSGQAESSVCPRGWKLPVSNSNVAGSFGGLVDAGQVGTDIVKLTSAPYYFVRGGYVFQAANTLFVYAGEFGRYWSSTPSSDGINAYGLYFDSGNLVKPSLASTYGRRNGYSVRCIAR